MFGLGAGEIAIILFIALVFIGPEKLPGLAKTLAKSVGEFQRAMRGVTQSIRDPMDQIKEQIQTQANAQPRGDFNDDPEHDHNFPDDETGHGEVEDPWGPKEDADAMEEKIAKDTGLQENKKPEQKS